MFTFGNDEKDEKTGFGSDGNADAEQGIGAPEENGCTYHTGRIAPEPQDMHRASPDGESGNEPAQGAETPAGGYPSGGPGGYPYGGRQPYGARPPYGGQNGRQGNPYGGAGPNGNGWQGYPYGGAGQNGQQGYPYGSAGQNGRQNQPYGNGGKKKSGGVILLVVAIVAIVVVGLIGVVVGARSMFSSDPASRTAEERTPMTTTTGQGSEDGPSIDLAEPPEQATLDNAPVGENGYSAARVYEIIKDSSVGILVYDNESGELYSEGSGVIIGENDPHTRTYIVTCAHVINSMGISIKVMTSDDSTYDAQIVGYDKRTDLGVLMIKKTGLQSAEFAKVDGIRVGDTVYAIGNPGGSEFAGSFTNGMVSAIGRPVASSTSYTTKCIQHTAAINPGNSGGALVNAYGQVIGINSKKIVSTDYEGMGFAVPSDVVQEIANDLIVNGYIPNRAKLGITYLPASAYETYMMVVQLKEYPKGSIVIESITSDSNLRKEDVEKGDMIIAVNGKPLDDSDVLPNLMEKAKPGDQLTLTIVRISSSYTVKQFDVTVELIEDRGTAVEDEPEEETLFPEESDETDPFAYNPFD